LLQPIESSIEPEEADIRSLETIAERIAPILSARLLRKRAEDEVRTLNVELEKRVVERILRNIYRAQNLLHEMIEIFRSEEGLFKKESFWVEKVIKEAEAAFSDYEEVKNRISRDIKTAYYALLL
jgi:hypothetical protein